MSNQWMLVREVEMHITCIQNFERNKEKHKVVVQSWAQQAINAKHLTASKFVACSRLRPSQLSLMCHAIRLIYQTSPSWVIVCYSNIKRNNNTRWALDNTRLTQAFIVSNCHSSRAGVSQSRKHPTQCSKAAKPSATRIKTTSNSRTCQPFPGTYKALQPWPISYSFNNMTRCPQVRSYKNIIKIAGLSSDKPSQTRRC